MLISFCNVCKMKYIKLNWISDGNLMFFGHAWKSIIFLAKSSETLDSNFCLQNGYKTGVLWKTILIHSRYNIKYVTIKSSAGEATVSDFDIEATNGVVHIVDHVFWFVMLLYHTSLFCQIICCWERICVFFQFGRFFQTFLLCSSNFAGQGAEKVNIVFK